MCVIIILMRILRTKLPLIFGLNKHEVKNRSTSFFLITLAGCHACFTVVFHSVRRPYAPSQASHTTHRSSTSPHRAHYNTYNFSYNTPNFSDNTPNFSKNSPSVFSFPPTCFLVKRPLALQATKATSKPSWATKCN